MTRSHGPITADFKYKYNVTNHHVQFILLMNDRIGLSLKDFWTMKGRLSTAKT